DQQIAAANRLLNAEGFLHQELTIHHGDAPVSSPLEKLAGLEAIAEMTQHPADDDSFGCARQPIEARGRGTREDRLTDSFNQAACEARRIEAEEKDADARPAVRRFVRKELR